jgi:hypothetical protein
VGHAEVGHVEEAARAWRRFHRTRRWLVPVGWLGFGTVAGAAVLAGAPGLARPDDRDDTVIGSSDPDVWVGPALLAVGLLGGSFRARQPDLVGHPVTRVMRSGAASHGTAEVSGAWIRWAPAERAADGARGLLVRWDDVVDLELSPLHRGTGIAAWTADGSSLWLRVPSPDDAALLARIDRIRPQSPPSTSR